MRYGNQAEGLTWLTLKPSTVARWVLSLHTSSQLRGDLLVMKDKQHNNTTTTHREEAPGRITSDTSYRQKSNETPRNYIDPITTDIHPRGLLNVVTGLHATDQVNACGESIKNGHITEFESGWPTSFNKTLTNNVTLMTTTKKDIKLEGKPVHGTDLIFTRVVICLQTVDILISHMYSPKNFSQCQHHIFGDRGAMLAQSKAVTKTKFQVEQSSRINDYRMLS